MTGDGARPGPAPPTLIDRVGRREAAFLYVTAATVGLCGPVMLGFAALTDAQLMLIGVVFTVVFVPVGPGLWGDTVVGREHNRRLDAVGIPATAEIIDLTDFDWSGEESGVEVGLRVSGPGLRTFGTTWRRARHPGLRVGRQLDAVVDLSGGRFRVES
ncbi:hypothetical protein ACFWOB_27250 [Streptomyces sp. NPDC058420]|uniref:hypothetical protein n=1 Tax=Streptomyces sp. NPDC058420 TaxID=3346489 RepID=UPI00365DD504